MANAALIVKGTCGSESDSSIRGLGIKCVVIIVTYGNLKRGALKTSFAVHISSIMVSRLLNE